MSMPLPDAVLSMHTLVPIRFNAEFWCDDPKGGDPAEWPEAIRVRQFPEPRR